MFHVKHSFLYTEPYVSRETLSINPLTKVKMNKELKKNLVLYIILVICYLLMKTKYFYEEYSTLEFLTLLSAALIPIFIFSKYDISTINVVVTYVIFFHINLYLSMNKYIWIICYFSLVIVVLLIERTIKRK